MDATDPPPGLRRLSILPDPGPAPDPDAPRYHHPRGLIARLLAPRRAAVPPERRRAQLIDIHWVGRRAQDGRGTIPAVVPGTTPLADLPALAATALGPDQLLAQLVIWPGAAPHSQT